MRPYRIGEGFEEFELFGEAEDGPGEAAGPGGEGGVALLGTGTAVGAVVEVEDALVGGAAADVPGVAAFAIVDAVAGGAGTVISVGSNPACISAWCAARP